ncbi:MAG TPA: hypothetical protein VFP65_15590, partial [Anaeromyxobacteraceae bacterium]|nr:hypothetical protein [Anaeromyxobacteraceae bacterium]
MEHHGDTGGGAAGGNGGGGDLPAGRPGDASAQLLEANRRLRESAQRRDDLLTLVASDLRGPSAALLRHVRRLREGDGALSHGERRALEALERQARRVAAIAEGLLALNTLEAGRIPLDRQPVDLRALLSRAVEARAALAAERGVAFALDLPATGVVVPADAARLEQAAGALLDAAVAATVRGDRVRASLESLPDGARFTVEDGRPAAEVHGA